MSRIKIIRYVMILILFSILLPCASLVVSGFGNEADWPYNVGVGFLYGGWSANEDGFIDVSLMDAEKADPSVFKVYDSPYTYTKRMGLLFTADDEYYMLCKKSIDAFLEAAGIAESDIDDTPRYGYQKMGKYLKDDEVGQLSVTCYINFTENQKRLLQIIAVGSRLSFLFDTRGSAENIEQAVEELLSYGWFNAVKNIVGINEIEYTEKVIQLQTSPNNNKIYAEIPIYDAQNHESRYSAPPRIVFNDARKWDQLTVFIEEPKEAGVNVSRRIGYEEAKKRLKENEWYALAIDTDLSVITDEDIYACDIIYSDITNMRYLVPCYRFYVRCSSYNPSYENTNHYSEFYVPAVEFEEKNPGTGDAGVCAVAAVSLLSLIAAQYVYKKSKRA